MKIFFNKKEGLREKEIKTNMEVSSGEITQFRTENHRVSQVIDISYQFKVDNKIITAQKSWTAGSDDEMNLKDWRSKQYGIVYSLKDYSVNDILITSDDSAKYGVGHGQNF